MTFTKFNEFRYTTTGARVLYMLSSHAQLALFVSAIFTTWYAVYLVKLHTK